MNNLNESEKNRKKILTGAFIALFLGISALVALFASHEPKEEVELPPSETAIAPFQNISLDAKAAFVWDIKRGQVVYEKNADEILPLASLAKVMTAITAVELIPEHTVVTVRADFLNEEGDAGLLPGERFSLKDILNFSLLTSSNDAVAAVASAAGGVVNTSFDLGADREEFVRQMNLKANELGMESLSFSNESGLDVNEMQSGAYGSARDVAKLFEYALVNYPELMVPTRNDAVIIASQNNIIHNAINTNVKVNEIPGILASKTGYTDLSGGNLAVALDPGVGRPFIVVVLGSTFEGRFNDVVALSTETLDYLTVDNPAFAETEGYSYNLNQ